MPDRNVRDSTADSRLADLPNWLLAIGPVLILGTVAGLLYLTSPFGDAQSMADAGTSEILWMITVIGIFAGVVPVAIGMLWFPFVKSLRNRRVHAVLALSAGVLAFVALEMVEEIVEYGSDVGSLTTTGVAAVVAGLATALVMKVIGDWRREQVYGQQNQGLRVAYLIAVGLGFHSVGEGLAIGASFQAGAYSLVTLLVVGFVLHNVTEGLTVVSAMARDEARPPLRHFVAIGLIAGGPLVFGGWLGVLAFHPLVAVVFLAIGVGAIAEVLFEVVELIRMDAEEPVTVLNGASFALGIGVMFVLEEIIVEGYLL